MPEPRSSAPRRGLRPSSLALMTRARRSCNVSRSVADSGAMTLSRTARMVGYRRSNMSRPAGVSANSLPPRIPTSFVPQTSPRPSRCRTIRRILGKPMPTRSESRCSPIPGASCSDAKTAGVAEALKCTQGRNAVGTTFTGRWSLLRCSSTFAYGDLAWRSRSMLREQTRPFLAFVNWSIRPITKF
jgi:hypothetical protein